MRDVLYLSLFLTSIPLTLYSSCSQLLLYREFDRDLGLDWNQMVIMDELSAVGRGEERTVRWFCADRHRCSVTSVKTYMGNISHSNVVDKSFVETAYEEEWNSFMSASRWSYLFHSCLR